MKCDEAGILLHALIDGELDAGNTREIEEHVETCPHCADHLRQFEELHRTMTSAQLRYTAPVSLRSKISSALPARRVTGPSRRAAMKGFGLGAVASALAASGAFMIAMRADEQQRILEEVVSAHLRSLHGQHLMDVESTDQHTVKPWFNGRLDFSPPVIDLTAEDFTLLGGRLDYVDAKPVAAIVYRRRLHIINLFCVPTLTSTPRRVLESVQGFNIWRRNLKDLSFWAVSDINTEELVEFGQKFETAAVQ
jgi:anti-sigma factor RsiW